MRQPPSPASPSRAQMRERRSNGPPPPLTRCSTTPGRTNSSLSISAKLAACSFGEELAAWLLEQHVAADPCVRPPADQAPVCPKCGRPGQRVTPAEHTLP